jgi:cytochrome c5
MGTRFLLAIALSTALSACGGNAPRPANTPVGDEGAAAAIAAVPSLEDQKRMAAIGADVFKKYGCGSCHSRSNQREGLAGPPLGKTGEAHVTRQGGDELAARRWFFAHIRNPKAHPGLHHADGAYSGTRMPGYTQISDSEMRALVEFIMTLR